MPTPGTSVRGRVHDRDNDRGFAVADGNGEPQRDDERRGDVCLGRRERDDRQRRENLGLQLVDLGRWNRLAVTLSEALTYAQAFSEGAGATVTLTGGNLTLTGSASLAGGTVNGSHSLKTKGTTTVSGVTIGGTVVWDNTNTVTQSGGAVTIGGANGDKAELDNASAGIYDIVDDSGIARGSSVASYILNAGLLEKTGGTGTSAITPKINNTGAIAVTSGTLDLGGAVMGRERARSWAISTLEFGSTVSANQTIDFAGGRSVVDLIDPRGFSGQIENFASPDAVDLSGDWVFSGFSENSARDAGHADARQRRNPSLPRLHRRLYEERFRHRVGDNHGDHAHVTVSNYVRSYSPTATGLRGPAVRFRRVAGRGSYTRKRLARHVLGLDAKFLCR